MVRRGECRAHRRHRNAGRGGAVVLAVPATAACGRVRARVNALLPKYWNERSILGMILQLRDVFLEQLLLGGMHLFSLQPRRLYETQVSGPRRIPLLFCAFPSNARAVCQEGYDFPERCPACQETQTVQHCWNRPDGHDCCQNNGMTMDCSDGCGYVFLTTVLKNVCSADQACEQTRLPQN